MSTEADTLQLIEQRLKVSIDEYEATDNHNALMDGINSALILISTYKLRTEGFTNERGEVRKPWSEKESARRSIDTVEEVETRTYSMGGLDGRSARVRKQNGY